MKRKLNAVMFIQEYLTHKILPGAFCVDATAGRGKDTLFLCEKVGQQGKVIALDIQEEAVQSTACLLEKNGYHHRAQIFCDTHSNMDQYAEKETVDCIIFNLGYLPGANHQIATKPDVTICAIEKGLQLLKKGGIMSICIYHGGDSGFEERDILLEYFRQVDQDLYTVLVCDFYNRENHPPIPVFIIKEE